MLINDHTKFYLPTEIGKHCLSHITRFRRICAQRVYMESTQNVICIYFAINFMTNFNNVKEKGLKLSYVSITVWVIFFSSDGSRIWLVVIKTNFFLKLCWQIAIAFTYRRNGKLISCKYRDVNKKFWQVIYKFYHLSFLICDRSNKSFVCVPG